MTGNLSGLVELSVVVVLLAWFWRSQTTATSKNPPPDSAEDTPSKANARDQERRAS
jgi:hypothetical protein